MTSTATTTYEVYCGCGADITDHDGTGPKQHDCPDGHRADHCQCAGDAYDGCYYMTPQVTPAHLREYGGLLS